MSDILIVDDNPANLRLLLNLLSKAGYHVRPTRDGQTALISAQMNPPDLILLDIMMPVPDGYAVCSLLKADERTRDIPIIFVSALNEVFDKLKAFSVGGVDYITKPFHEEEVLVRVSTHLTLQRLQKQLKEQNALLQEQNTRFRTLEEATFEGIVIHDERRILEVNHRSEEMFDYQRSEMINKDLLHFIAPAFHLRVQDYFRSEDEAPHRIEGLRRERTIFPLEIQSRSMPLQGQNVRVSAIRDLSRQHQLEQENLTLRATIQDRYRLGEIIGKSPAMQKIYELIVNAAATEYGVLIYGESGTGKELVARTIHRLSRRQHQAFVPVNCGAITESLFEREFFGHRKGAFTGADRNIPGLLDAACGGTLFLDEVAELSPAMQVKLLRVLENGEYMPLGDTTVKYADVRIIAATNRNLEALLHQRIVREDFFYRIHVIAIQIPPLRERREDIPLLIEHILSQESPEHAPQKLPISVMEHLSQENWPGNVRQLQNTLQHYLITGELIIQGRRFPESEPALPEITSLFDAVDQFEKQMIIQTLARNRGNRTATARMLKITRRALYTKLQKYHIS